MRFIDLDSGELRPLMTADPLESETSKRGSAPNYAVQFARNGLGVELLDTPGTPPVVATVILGFKAQSAFDSVTYVAGPFTAAKSQPGGSDLAVDLTNNLRVTSPTHNFAVCEIAGSIRITAGGAYAGGTYTIMSILNNGAVLDRSPAAAGSAGGVWVEPTSTVYTFALSFLTAALDQLLATNLDDIDLAPEIKWASLNENGETLDFTWTIQNNVNRGGESVSTYPVTAIAVDLPAVSRLTGGILATDLDGQALAGFPNATKFDVVTDLTGTGVLGESRWQKRAGSEVVTDLPGGFILCTDGTRLYRIFG